MYKPLLELEFTNANCRIFLTKTLANYHKVRTVGGPGEETSDQCRGLAFYLAFDPWQTSLKYPPGSARFFDVAEKTGLISIEESKQLSQTLIRHGAEMAQLYNGKFSPFFNESRVRTILQHVDDLEHLSGSALAVGASWADRLLETSPIPFQPERHLEVQSFRQITLEGEIEFYSQSPWLAWVEALDLICLGPWAGFKSQTNIKMVEALQNRVKKLSSGDFDLENRLLGRKVNLPMYSRGLQGVVVGVFTDVPKTEIEPILTTLVQFGETISDVYADLRWKHFIEALEGELDEDGLAREVINVVSPIARLVVSHEGRKAGYRLGYEHNYWSGYERLSKEELKQEPSKAALSIAAPNGAQIHIEPLTDIPQINPDFTRIRIENYLTQVFGAIATASNGEVLPLKDVRALLAEYEPYASDPAASLAKLRQYFVVAKVARNWESGAVKVSNSELKSFLEDKGRDAKNGYQVTSFASEFEKIFGGRITATKTRNAVSLAWNKGQ